MAHVDIKTIPELRAAIKLARCVWVQPRFGTSERWVKITKVEALEMIHAYTDSDTPANCEMYGGVFGEYRTPSRALFMG
jgi:hypothetical protein